MASAITRVGALTSFLPMMPLPTFTGERAEHVTDTVGNLFPGFVPSGVEHHPDTACLGYQLIAPLAACGRPI